jgi:hypothetical protein
MRWRRRWSVSGGLESRVKSLERAVSVEDAVRVFVTWGEERADVVDLAPGETLRVVRWRSDDTIEVEEARA